MIKNMEPETEIYPKYYIEEVRVDGVVKEYHIYRQFIPNTAPLILEEHIKTPEKAKKLLKKYTNRPKNVKTKQMIYLETGDGTVIYDNMPPPRKNIFKRMISFILNLIKRKR
jgi:(2Fe-2S) ferredoxin